MPNVQDMRANVLAPFPCVSLVLEWVLHIKSTCKLVRSGLVNFGCQLTPQNCAPERRLGLILDLGSCFSNLQAMDAEGAHESSASDDETANDPGVAARDLKRQLAVLAAGHAIVQNLDAPTKSTAKQCQWGGDAARALAGLLELHGLSSYDPDDQKMRAKHGEFCRKWHARFMEAGSITGNAPGAGRKRKLSDTELEEALTIIESTQFARRDDAKYHPRLAAMLADSGASVGTLFRNLKEAYPKFGKFVLVEYKTALKPDHIKSRLQMAVAWLNAAAPAVAAPEAEGAPPAERMQVEVDGVAAECYVPKRKEHLDTSAFDRCIFLDAKKIYIKPQQFKAWGRKGRPSWVIQDARTGRWALHYYAAVNYKHGGLLIKLVTGTKGKGYKAKQTYLVSPSICLYAGVAMA